MPARLGQAIYLAACAIAALMLLYGVYLVLTLPQGERSPALGTVVLSVVIWMVGRALRYVLAGR